MTVVARLWDSTVVLEREFRVFVVRGVATAITQYDDQLCHAFARDHGAAVVPAILDALERLQPSIRRLGLADTCFVADFAVVPGPHELESGQLKARLIELNPFGPVTGASLFDWRSNRRVLQGGHDVYGDLDTWEQKYPAASGAVPNIVQEEVIAGTPYRTLREHPPGMTWQHIRTMWQDYDRLSPLLFST